MTTIYLVRGQSGELDDYDEWIVVAYPTREMAEAHAEIATALADVLVTHYKSKLAIPDGINPYDPAMQVRGLSVQYQVLEVELQDRLPSSGEEQHEIYTD